jgi:branched-chain amino acid transport system substrate-binding protein
VIRWAANGERPKDGNTEEEHLLKERRFMALLVLMLAALALAASSCGGDDDDEAGGGGTGTEQSDGGGGVTALPSSSCRALEYKGEGDADILIASDLPRQGGSRLQTTQMVGAIRLLLEEKGWKSGDYNIAFQDCDDATAQAGKWDSGKCSQNAQAYAQNESVGAVIGTFNSGCAAVEIPVLNQAPGGGVLMVSPANTYGCLTEPCAGNEPEKYYPSGTRNYARVAPSDPNQGAVVAQIMKEQGVKSVYILNDKEAYGLGVAKNVKGAAEAAGIKVTGFAAYEPKSANFEALFTKIKGTNPDAVFIGGLIDENAGQLINDKVAVLGPNTGVKLYLPDGFATDAVFQPAEGGTAKAKDAIFTVAGAPVDQFKGKGGEFAKKFQDEVLKGKPVDPYAILAVQAADVVLQAIANSDGSRASILEELFKLKVTDGYIGGFEFNENGDVTGASGAVLTFSVYKGTNKLTTLKTATPEANLIDAARQEAAG